MRISPSFPLFFGLFSTAAARICKYPYRYCASTLRAIGYTEDEIMEPVLRGGCPADRDPDHYLFYCARGNVENYLSLDHNGYCSPYTCKDMGSGNYDQCVEEVTVTQSRQGTPITRELCPKPKPIELKNHKLVAQPGKFY